MNRRIIAFIIMLVCLVLVVYAAVTQYTFNGLLLLVMVILVGCVAYLMKHDFTI